MAQIKPCTEMHLGIFLNIVKRIRDHPSPNKILLLNDIQVLNNVYKENKQDNSKIVNISQSINDTLKLLRAYEINKHNVKVVV